MCMCVGEDERVGAHKSMSQLSSGLRMESPRCILYMYLMVVWNKCVCHYLHPCTSSDDMYIQMYTKQCRKPKPTLYIVALSTAEVRKSCKNTVIVWRNALHGVQCCPLP